MSADALIPVRDRDDLATVWQEPLAVLYKHSPLCGLSASASREVRRFVESHPDVPVYIVDVIRSRAISLEVERQLSIRHESPQAFVLRSGEVAWHDSHRGVTTDALVEALES